MEEYIAFDSHKFYTLVERQEVETGKAKLMMGMINKTDKLDVSGLNKLQRNGTLPTVWIAPRELRELRELTRTRMVFSAHRTRLKNRIHSTLSKYGWMGSRWNDRFGQNGREELRLASHSNTTPRVHASGDKVRYGRLRPDVNHYLRWAYIEAANSASLNLRYHPHRHVSLLYMRLRHRKGHKKAIGAVARHLAESTYHVLSKGEPYRDPALKKGLSRGA